MELTRIARRATLALALGGALVAGGLCNALPAQGLETLRVSESQSSDAADQAQEGKPIEFGGLSFVVPQDYQATAVGSFMYTAADPSGQVVVIVMSTDSLLSGIDLSGYLTDEVLQQAFDAAAQQASDTYGGTIIQEGEGTLADGARVYTYVFDFEYQGVAFNMILGCVPTTGSFTTFEVMVMKGADEQALDDVAAIVDSFMLSSSAGSATGPVAPGNGGADTGTATDGASAEVTYAGLSFEVPSELVEVPGEADQRAWRSVDGSVDLIVLGNLGQVDESVTIDDFAGIADVFAESLEGEVVGSMPYGAASTDVYIYGVLVSVQGTQRYAALGFIPVADGSLSCVIMVQDVDSVTESPDVVDGVFSSIALA